MKNYKSVEENETSFKLSDGKRETLVAKNKISEGTQERFRKMPGYFMGGSVKNEPGKWIEGVGEDYQDRFAAPQQSYKDAVLAEYRSRFNQPDDTRIIPDFFGSTEAPKNILTGDFSPAETEAADSSLMSTRGPGLPEQIQPTPYDGESPPAQTESAEQYFARTGKIPDASFFEQKLPKMKQEKIDLTIPEMGGGLGAKIDAAERQQAAGIRGGMREKAAGEADKAAILEQAYGPEAVKNLNMERQRLQEEGEYLRKTTEDFREKAEKGEIDPNRFWGSKSTGNKIASVIGLILGGAGSGGNAANNAALNIINKQIQRDITAQQADMSKNMNMYKINLQRYKDNFLARQATEMQMKSAITGQISAQAARTNSKMAKHQSNQMIGAMKNQFLTQKIQLEQMQHQKAMQRFRAKLLQQAKRTPGFLDPQQGISNLVPKELQKEAWKEYGAYRNVQSAKKQASKVIRDAYEASKHLVPFQRAEFMKRKFALMFPVVKQIAGERLGQDEAIAMIQPFLSDLISTKESSRKAEEDIFSALEAQVPGRTQILEQHGVIPRKFSPEQMGMKRRGK